mgnify:CR=1 FL=1
MKKLFIILALVCMSVLSTSAQEIYDEVRRIEKEAKAFANDTKNNLEARKIATFKYDAIYYLIDKASQEPLFSEYELGVQTNAMIEFVNLFVSKLSTLKKNKDKDMLKAVFRTATINNSLFNDVDKEVIYSYVDNENFITQFSLDTDWPKALAEVQETLGKVAENVMKTMISSDEVTSIDVREMRLMQAKLSINQTLAKKEQYSIPVLVGDKVTNVSLKIVRGVETKGIVDIMLESEMSGKIAATFQAKEEGISGLVVTDKQETRDLLADQMGFLASAIQESGGEQVDLRFAVEKNLDLNHFSGVASGKSGNVTFAGDPAASAKETVDKEGQSTEGEKEDSVYKVQTARLYHIAEAFLRTIREFE